MDIKEALEFLSTPKGWGGQLGLGAELDGWHEYAVEWDAEQIRFYFDGVMYSVFNVTTDAARASFTGTLMTLSIEGFAPPYSESIDYVKFRKPRGETMSPAGGGTRSILWRPPPRAESATEPPRSTAVSPSRSLTELSFTPETA